MTCRRTRQTTWLGLRRNCQEWAQACSEVRQAVHTTAPVSQSPSPLRALNTQAGLSNSWAEGGSSEDMYDNKREYLSEPKNLKSPSEA